MFARLTNTDTRRIDEKLSDARGDGVGASGQVLTLVIITTPKDQPEVSGYAVQAGRLHPSRVLVIVRDPSSEVPEGSTGIDAEIRVGEAIPGEMVTLWISGEAEHHAESIVVPLLLPQLPVVLWWPRGLPDGEADKGILDISPRRIVDSAMSADQMGTLDLIVDYFQDSTTDLSWTRLTRWRSLLVGMLDQGKEQPVAVRLEAPDGSAPAALMAAWLEMQLGCPVERCDYDGPGLGSVTFTYADGTTYSLTRDTGTTGIVSLGDGPQQYVALARRAVDELIGEELVRLEGDEMFDALIHSMRERKNQA